MQHSCSVCGKAFESNRSHARYCSSTCRGRALRSRKASDATADVVELKTPAPKRSRVAEEPPAVANLASAVTRQLLGANKLDTYQGQQALLLAQRLDRSAIDTGSAVAALSKELDRLMAVLLKDAKPTTDELDELVGQVVEFRRSGRRG